MAGAAAGMPADSSNCQPAEPAQLAKLTFDAGHRQICRPIGPAERKKLHAAHCTLHAALGKAEQRQPTGTRGFSRVHCPAGPFCNQPSQPKIDRGKRQKKKIQQKISWRVARPGDRPGSIRGSHMRIATDVRKAGSWRI